MLEEPMFEEDMLEDATDGLPADAAAFDDPAFVPEGTF
jgi:hypothetical protein